VSFIFLSQFLAPPPLSRTRAVLSEYSIVRARPFEFGWKLKVRAVMSVTYPGFALTLL